MISSIHRFSAKCTTSCWSGHWILTNAKTFKFLSDNDLGKTITPTKILARRFLKKKIPRMTFPYRPLHFFGGLKVALYEKTVAEEKTAPMKPTHT